MSMPVKCPICEGHGIVPGGFYQITPGVLEWSSTNATEICRACGGSGIIWTWDQAPKMPMPYWYDYGYPVPNRWPYISGPAGSTGEWSFVV